MNFDLQLISLKDDFVTLHPLKPGDFEALYEVASDPLIWEQHPNKDRYKKAVFENFFEDALKSGGAFLILNTKTNQAIGSSRFYEYNELEKTVVIGYTFLAKDHWGTVYNRALKKIMIDHAFKFVNVVVFYIGSENIRSQKAISKLGAFKVGETETEYYGEAKKLNYIYQIKKEDWLETKV